MDVMKDGLYLLPEIEILTEIEGEHNKRVRSIARLMNFRVTDDLLLDLTSDIEERQAQYEEFKRAVDSLPDGLEKVVFRLRYIEGLTAEQTADTLHYSMRHILRLSKRAINILQGEEQ